MALPLVAFSVVSAKELSTSGLFSLVWALWSLTVAVGIGASSAILVLSPAARSEGSIVKATRFAFASFLASIMITFFLAAISFVIITQMSHQVFSLEEHEMILSYAPAFFSATLAMQASIFVSFTACAFGFYQYDTWISAATLLIFTGASVLLKDFGPLSGETVFLVICIAKFIPGIVFGTWFISRHSASSSLACSVNELLAALRLAIPLSTTFFAESAVFFIFAFLCAAMGTKAGSTYQSIMNLSNVIYMVSIALGTVCTVFIASLKCEISRQTFRDVWTTALRIAIMFAALLCTIFFIYFDDIASFLRIDENEGARKALLFVIVLVPAEAVLVISRSCLRGVGDVKYPLYIILVVNWIFLVPLSFFLYIFDFLNVESVYFIMLIGGNISAAMVFIRLLRQTRGLPEQKAHSS